MMFITRTHHFLWTSLASGGLPVHSLAGMNASEDRIAGEGLRLPVPPSASPRLDSRVRGNDRFA
jgi:hypothetical protein